MRSPRDHGPIPHDPNAPLDIRLGFACLWDDPPESTWSYTPWNLRKVLSTRMPVVDVSPQLGPVTRAGLKILGAHRSEGRWTTSWGSHPATVAITERRLARAVHAADPDVVLQIGDIGDLPGTPFLLYQDLSWDIVLERLDLRTDRSPQFSGIGSEQMKRLRRRQHEIYHSAAGVITMSNWLAEHLVSHTGLPRSKVFVVPPGANGLPDGPVPLTGRPRRRMLFIGKDFTRKGGDVVLEALEILRKDVDPRIELTVVGPEEWPLEGEVPEGVRFLGRLPLADVQALFAGHDVFVMPSRFEGYGIALIEALAHGLPCVARRDCAMPEIIRPGDNGALIDATGGPADLAIAVAGVLADTGLHERTRAAAAGVAMTHTWARAADDVARIVRSVL